MFWSCNMKQLNFKHFNINSKKFTVTVIFFHNETQTSPKNPIMIILFSTSRGFRSFCDNSHLFQKISEDYRRYPKMSKENRRFLRRNPKIFKEQIRIDKYAKRLRFFSRKTLQRLNSIFSFKLANFTANSKNYGQMAPNNIQTLLSYQPLAVLHESEGHSLMNSCYRNYPKSFGIHRVPNDDIENHHHLHFLFHHYLDTIISLGEL